MKGFSFGFVGLIGNILKDTANYYLLITSIIVIIIFWILDSFYLKMEKTYRDIEEVYDVEKGLNYKKYNIKKSIIKIMFSKTIWPLYFAQVLFVTVLSLTVIGVI